MSSSYAGYDETDPGTDRRKRPDRRSGDSAELSRFILELDEIHEKVSKQDTFWQRWGGMLTLAAAILLPLTAFLFTAYGDFTKLVDRVGEFETRFSNIQDEFSRRPTAGEFRLHLSLRDTEIDNLKRRQDEASKSVDRRLKSIDNKVDSLNGKMDRLIEKQIPVIR